MIVEDMVADLVTAGWWPNGELDTQWIAPNGLLYLGTANAWSLMRHGHGVMRRDNFGSIDTKTQPF